MSLDQKFIDRVFVFGPLQQQATWIYDNWSPVWADDSGAHLICANYDVENRSCLAYDTRPPVCSEFPFYGKEPNLGQGPRSLVCGYQAEAGRTVLPIVEVR